MYPETTIEGGAVPFLVWGVPEKMLSAILLVKLQSVHYHT